MSDPLLSSNDHLRPEMASSGFGLSLMGSSQRGPPSPPWDDDDVLMDFDVDVDVEKSVVSAVTDVDDFLSCSPTSLRLDSDTDEAISSFLKSEAAEKGANALERYLDDETTLKKSVSSSVMFWKDFCESTTSDDFVGDGVLCTTCNVTFASMASVSRHICDASNDRSSLSSASSFDDHWKDFDVAFASGKASQDDELCRAVLNSVDKLESHFSVDSGVSINDEDGSSLASFTSSDDESSKSVFNDTFVESVKIEDDATSTSTTKASEVSHCGVCKLVFSSRQKLETHTKTFAAKVACCHCGKSFATASKLRIHHRKHSKEKPFQCQCCEKYFMHRNTLVRHQQLHCVPLRGKLDAKVDEVIVEIDLMKDSDQMAKMILDAIGSSAALLAGPERKRKSEPSVAKAAKTAKTDKGSTSCKICDNEFFDLKSLENHRDYHLKQRSCCRCHKVMVSKSKLLIHHRSHTKELPYACKVCDRSFAEKSTLTKHAATHGEKNFRCDVCEKAFVRKDYLAKHSLTHRQTYKCSQCSFVCYNRQDIEQHVVAAHPAV